MTLDRETIYGIVEDGKYTRAEAVLLQDGQPLTKEQRTWWTEASLLKKANADKRRERKRSIDAIAAGGDDDAGPMSGAERVRRHRDAYSTIDAELADARKRIDRARRERAEQSLEAWIATYGIGVFINDPPPKPWGSKILREMEEANAIGRPYQILIGRGGGKTSYAEADAARAVATGAARLVVISSINASQAQQIKREIDAVFTSEPFATDYPDIALPIILLDGHGRRAQRYAGKDTKVRITTDRTQLPTIVDRDGTVSPASGACIIAKALKSVRGTKNGTQRPDKVILDDLQNSDIARNPERVAEVLSLVRGDVMGLSGKGKMSITFTATTIAPDDVTEQLAADVAWKTTRNPSVIKWPTEWRKENHGLWGEYYAMFDRENAGDLKHTRRGGSLAFYRKNRAAMDAGADILNWDSFDRSKGQISGLQKLLDKYHEMGHAAFMAEHQMEPQRDAFAIEIAPRIIMERVRRGVPRGFIMDGAVLTVAATDINPSYALTTAWASFDVMRTCLVGGYGITRLRIDAAANDTEFHRQVYDALARTAEQIRGYGVRFDRWGIDAGGRQFQPVTRFASMCEAQYGVRAVAMTGRAGRNWNPNVRSKIRAALNSTVLCRDERTGLVWLAWNADEYKESAQKAWFAEVGSPGGCSLFDGEANHTDFAVQVANEKLIDKRPLPGGFGFAYNWKTREPHDYGDCMAMLYALAGAEGLNGDGAPMGGNRRQRKRYGYE